MTVLLIDDEKLSVQVRAELLRTLGHDVLTAHTGKEGLEVVLRQPVDVVVLDLGLPDMDGEDVLRGIRSMQDDARVVVLSGRLAVSDYVVSAADAVVVKGSGAQALLDALRG